MKSKYHLYCCCVYCHTEITVQSLKGHVRWEHTKKCKQCSCVIRANKTFCNNSCAASYNNSKREKKSTGPTRRELRIQKEIRRFNDGVIKYRPTLRGHLSRLRGYKCHLCGISIWNDKPITLRVDHIDGNASNNIPSNLRLLCPNCDSQTDTFSGRNKGNGRQSRGLPLH